MATALRAVAAAGLVALMAIVERRDWPLPWLILLLMSASWGIALGFLAPVLSTTSWALRLVVGWAMLGALAAVVAGSVRGGPCGSIGLAEMNALAASSMPVGQLLRTRPRRGASLPLACALLGAAFVGFAIPELFPLALVLALVGMATASVLVTRPSGDPA